MKLGLPRYLTLGLLLAAWTIAHLLGLTPELTAGLGVPSTPIPPAGAPHASHSRDWLPIVAMLPD